jgi:hypothetical protein
MVNAYEAVGLPIDITAAAEALGIPDGLIVDGGATVTGPNESSIYYLHGGDQTVTAGLGMNNFIMGGTFGHVVILDREPAPSANDPSILRFSDVRSTDVTATRDGLDLIIDVNGTGQQVRVIGEFTGVRPGIDGTGNLNSSCCPLVDGTRFAFRPLLCKRRPPRRASPQIFQSDSPAPNCKSINSLPRSVRSSTRTASSARSRAGSVEPRAWLSSASIEPSAAAAL